MGEIAETLRAEIMLAIITTAADRRGGRISSRTMPSPFWTGASMLAESRLHGLNRRAKPLPLFLLETRIHFTDESTLNRKSGEAKWRDRLFYRICRRQADVGICNRPRCKLMPARKAHRLSTTRKRSVVLRQCQFSRRLFRPCPFRKATFSAVPDTKQDASSSGRYSWSW